MIDLNAAFALLILLAFGGLLLWIGRAMSDMEC
jgi:hypothetical protein